MVASQASVQEPFNADCSQSLGLGGLDDEPVLPLQKWGEFTERPAGRNFFLGYLPSTFFPGILLFEKKPETLGKQRVFGKMVGKNGESTPRFFTRHHTRKSTKGCPISVHTVLPIVWLF